MKEFEMVNSSIWKDCRVRSYSFFVRGHKSQVMKERELNPKLVAIAIVGLIVGGFATEALAGLMTPGTTNPTNPATPTYVDSVLMDSIAFPNNSSATLYLREDGNATTTLTSYDVSDSLGDSYLMTTWSSPTIPPSTVIATNILIGSSCPSCTLSGTAFTFVSGHAYAISVYAQDGKQFSFQVARKQFTYQVTLSIGFGTNGYA